MFLDTLNMSIDLGTANLLIGIRGEGIVFNEPFLLAVERESGRIEAIGKEAERMAEKTPKGITVASPMRRGAIADFSLARSYIRQSLRTCTRGPVLRRPSVVVGTRSCANDIDRKALYQVLESAGVGTVTYCPDSLAAAAGLNLPILEPSGVAICDVGGGISEISVLCLGGVVATILVPVGGLDFNAAIRKHVQEKYSVVIGDQSAEYLKVRSGSGGAGDEDGAIAVSGVNRQTRLPQRLRVSPAEVQEVMIPLFTQISDGVKKAFRQISPELMADVVEGGIVFCGGSALLSGLRQLVEKEVGIAVTIAEAPLTCVIAGLTRALDEGGWNGCRRKSFVQRPKGWRT